MLTNSCCCGCPHTVRVAGVVGAHIRVYSAGDVLVSEGYTDASFNFVASVPGSGTMRIVVDGVDRCDPKDTGYTRTMACDGVTTFQINNNASALVINPAAGYRKIQSCVYPIKIALNLTDAIGVSGTFAIVGTRWVCTLTVPSAVGSPFVSADYTISDLSAGLAVTVTYCTDGSAPRAPCLPGPTPPTGSVTFPRGNTCWTPTGGVFSYVATNSAPPGNTIYGIGPPGGPGTPATVTLSE